MKILRPLLVSALVALVAACAATPDSNPRLDQLQADVTRLKNDGAVRANAFDELERAELYLQDARTTFAKEGTGNDLNHFIYLTETWVAITEATKALAMEEDRVERARQERDRVVLEARAARADVRRALAESEAREAALMASEAQAEREVAQLAAAEAAQTAALASERANVAEQIAAAEMARREAAEVAASEAAMAAEQAAAERMAAEEAIAAARAAADSEALRAAEAERAAAMAAEEAAELRSRLAELQTELDAKETERGLVLIIGDVLFDFDQAELRPQGVQQVEKIASFLREYPERQVRIEGFTDSVGAETYNQGLSERRANAVRDVLRAGEVSDERITSVGYGESYPAADNETNTGRALNRRVEVIISRGDEQIPERTT